MCPSPSPTTAWIGEEFFFSPSFSPFIFLSKLFPLTFLPVSTSLLALFLFTRIKMSDRTFCPYPSRPWKTPSLPLEHFGTLKAQPPMIAGVWAWAVLREVGGRDVISLVFPLSTILLCRKFSSVRLNCLRERAQIFQLLV